MYQHHQHMVQPQNTVEPQNLVQSQTMIQPQNMISGQIGSQYSQQQYMGSLPQHRQVTMQPMVVGNQPGGFNNHGPQGFDPHGLPQNLPQVSAGPAASIGGAQQSYSNFRHNAQRVPHPDDNPRWGNNNRGRRNFRSHGSHNRGRQDGQQNQHDQHQHGQDRFQVGTIWRRIFYAGGGD
jgi:hypothetical protein